MIIKNSTSGKNTIGTNTNDSPVISNDGTINLSFKQ
jgi:hypothetical protein